MLTRRVAAKNRLRPRFFDVVWRVDTGMTQPDNPVLNQAARQILDGGHLSVLATTNADGRAPTPPFPAPSS
jgi:hypothetical protein